MADINNYSSQINLGTAYVQGLISGANNSNLQPASFKEVLKEVYDKIDNMTVQLAGDADVITVDGTTIDKTSAAASFLITQKMDQYQQIISMMMDLLTKSRDLDKTLGQSMSKG